MADGVFQLDRPELREPHEGFEWTDVDVCNSVLFAISEVRAKR